MQINQDENARKLWEVLTSVSREKRLITYSDVASRMGIHHRVVRFPLGKVQQYCFEARLPPLTILVVSKATMTPGEGFTAWDIDDIDTGIENVQGFNWSQVENPFQFAQNGISLKDVVDKIFDSPERAGDMFALVKVRGVAQVVFRKLLLRTYNEECSFCGLSFSEALEAAHIIPWSIASPAQRLDPTNGILLCSVHHMLFDNGYLTLSLDGKIEYCDPQGTEYAPYSVIDHTLTIDLHQRLARLPRRIGHRPSEEALSFHRREIFS